MFYEYDPFQKKAITAIEKEHSVLVSAPTGAGKTAIAEYAIERALERNERIIYTAPIKALSNQKYRDFLVHYPTKVGILTGDVAISPDAQVLIMTTEIYRNQLFENPEKHRNTAWVIFDEIHYLDDLERGTVWEEAIMFSHPETRFLGLSATAPNIEELASWIRDLHQHEITVVQESERPVKLVHHFQCQDVIYSRLEELKKRGYHGRDTWSYRGMRRGRSWEKHLRAKPNSITGLFRFLIDKDRLPCLYFAFGRRRVEELADQHRHFDLLSEDESRANVDTFTKACEKYDILHERSAVEMKELVSKGIAYHHAGMLPTLKEVVEQLFTARSIRLIFTTETFALGINMPARTVVFDELRKFYGFGFDHLTTRDYYQMAGRAGRRNMDTEGYVYSRVNPHDVPYSVIVRMVRGEMEPIRSQFNASYATLLNLYRHLGQKLIDIYPKSLHHYQSSPKKQKRGVRHIERKITLLEHMGYVTKDGLSPKGVFASWMYGYELMLSELHEAGFFDRLNPIELCVLLAAIVYEPRRGEHARPLPQELRYLEKEARRIMRHIETFEENPKVYPATKPAHFHMTRVVEAWVRGAEFSELYRMTEIDEGIVIRYFRMVIQLLRQIAHAPGTHDRLRKTCEKALPLINRDIVDAEKLLRNI